MYWPYNIVGKHFILALPATFLLVNVSVLAKTSSTANVSDYCTMLIVGKDATMPRSHRWSGKKYPERRRRKVNLAKPGERNSQ